MNLYCYIILCCEQFSLLWVFYCILLLTTRCFLFFFPAGWTLQRSVLLALLAIPCRPVIEGAEEWPLHCVGYSWLHNRNRCTLVRWESGSISISIWKRSNESACSATLRKPRMSSQMEYDCIVIGAGVQGSFTAYQLAKKKKATVLLEQVCHTEISQLALRTLQQWPAALLQRKPQCLNYFLLQPLRPDHWTAAHVFLVGLLCSVDILLCLQSKNKTLYWLASTSIFFIHEYPE